MIGAEFDHEEGPKDYVSPELIERMEKVFQCECLVSYGLTEAGPVVTVGRPKSMAATASEAERYRVQSMAGGIDRWSRFVDPKVPLY